MKSFFVATAALLAFTAAPAFAKGLQAETCADGQELLNVNVKTVGKRAGSLVICNLDEAKKCSMISVFSDTNLNGSLDVNDDLQGAGRRDLSVKADLQEKMIQSVGGAPAMGLCIEDETVVDMSVSGPLR